MDTQERKAHWDAVYGTKAETEVSWFQEMPSTSLELLKAQGISENSAILDVGGGASRLVDALLDRRFSNISVLDVSAEALAAAKKRLGAQRAAAVHWIQADVTRWSPAALYGVWHDRAVLHFLTNEAERAAYLRALRAATGKDALIVISTFDLDGPEKCSGLPVQRYSPASLAALLGADFRPLAARCEGHSTPWGSVQKFQFSSFVRVA